MNKEYRNLDELKNWDKNPRSITKKGFDRLKKQIKELGEYKPLIITPEGEVLGGNMRLRAYKELGYQKCWVSVVNPKSEADKVKIALSDNDRAGYYVEDQLAELTYSLPDFNFEDYSIDLKEPMSLADLLKDELPQIDLSGNIMKTYEIIIECESEQHQKTCYDRFLEEGYSCRLLAL